MEETVKEMEFQQQKLDNKNKILKQIREKEKTDNELKSDNLKKLTDEYNKKLEKRKKEIQNEENEKKKVEEQLKLIQQQNKELQLEFKTTVNKINEEKEIEKNKLFKEMEDQ
jgi:hypothetical protein